MLEKIGNDIEKATVFLEKVNQVMARVAAAAWLITGISYLIKLFIS